jgi:hypothetical protein
LFDVFTEKIDYYNIFLVLSFSFIIIIITIVLYWTILYNTAKKKSNCAEILTIIEENAVSKSPYVYTFAIIDKNSIEDKLSYFLLKIRYDFNTRNTKIEYGKDLNGENKLFDKLLLDYDRKLFLRAGDKIDKDNPVFKDTEESRKLQKDILYIVDEKITIDNYYKKLNKILNYTLFNEIFNELNLSEPDLSNFTDSMTMTKQFGDINDDKNKLDDIMNKVLVKSWKLLSVTPGDIIKHTQEHSHSHSHTHPHDDDDPTHTHQKAVAVHTHATHMHKPIPPTLTPPTHKHTHTQAHTHYISDPNDKANADHDTLYNIHSDINIAILTHRGYEDVSVSGEQSIDYYNNKKFNIKSYIIIDGTYYVPDKFETDPKNLINNKLDRINENLKEIFDFLLDYLGLQLNYPLESVNNYFNMQSRNSNNKKLRYYDLSSMKIKIIDGVNIDKIDNDFFKIVSVDKYNKIHKTYTSMKLLDFTRYTANATYAKKIDEAEDVELYNSDTIIYNIIYANKNKDKISL